MFILQHSEAKYLIAVQFKADNGWLHNVHVCIEDRDVTASVKACIGKFYCAANTVIGRIGTLSREEEIWRQVMMRQLLPVPSYGSHLWNLKLRKFCKLVDSAWRRVLRKGLGIGYIESVRSTVGDWCEEASKLMMRQQLIFVPRAVYNEYSLIVDVTLGTRKSSQLWTSVEEDVEIVTLLYSSYKRVKEVVYNT